MDERQPNQEYAQTSINTPVSLERTTRVSVGSSGRGIHSAGSSAGTSKRFGADSDVITPAKPATAERAYAADSVGSVSQGDNSGKREDLELRSTVRSKRVISVSGSLLSGPARRGRRRQTEEVEKAYGEELLTTAQDPEIQQAQDVEPDAINQTAMALSTSNPPISAALCSPFQKTPPISGKRAYLAHPSDSHAQRNASNSELQHHEPVPLSEIPSVHAKEFQASAPANSRRTSPRVLSQELMELGELDFNSLLKNRQSRAEGPVHSFDITFVRYYWKEMLDDLKPANFVLVKGRLKLIDFGIANAIQTDVTTNVYRESMAGTVNYMSPESLMDSTQYALTIIQNGHPYIPASGAPRVVKVGKPSDVWSLGCILYQMVYGIPPFGTMAEPRSRIQAIVNWSHHIEIPATTEDGSCVPVALLQTMRRCLSRDQTARPTCETLLYEANNFLYPKEHNSALSAPRDSQFLPMTEELLGRVIQSIRMRCREGFPADDKAVAAWTKAYWGGIEKAVRQPKP
ncbi:putative serine/threonine-protein kinase mps1 [Colletotrichum shisoi]|uniref:Putative serine/threonine-protein kinase mps1 n=1 Tax=Colletotrichum shisoi TaxID=2078593 RepID=A0A5Q4BV78_9PEZI|nr:putative serine/threonine-protein kinase mps1 [Colletotrichum shisoi]